MGGVYILHENLWKFHGSTEVRKRFLDRGVCPIQSPFQYIISLSVDIIFLLLENIVQAFLGHSI